jgi:isocitrate dehydrogenase kinase/phosphatase
MSRPAQQIAETLLRGFDRHYRIFLEITRGARERFSRCDWSAGEAAARERILLYNRRVMETRAGLRAAHGLDDFDPELWRQIKIEYIRLLYPHQQPELAETFYNSVFTSLFHRRYYNNEHIFVRPGLSTEYLEDEQDATYHCLYPTRQGLSRSLRRILLRADPPLPWEDLNRDVRRLALRVRETLLPQLELLQHFQLRVLNALFYRNKAAYIIGMGVNGDQVIPFAIPLLNNGNGQLFVDTLVSAPDDITSLFSFARSYFMVDTRTPSAVVEFLQRLLPHKTKADLYTAIGLQKQGKTEFYRDFLHHLKHSTDRLEIAPGIKGMVMTVFTLPSYPYVFKVINDRFAPPKKTSREQVERKYQIVKMQDRVGRMADTLEYSYAAFPLARISPALMREFERKIPSSLEIDGDMLIIRHLYIERRLTPLNLFLASASPRQAEQAMLEYAQAIKDMAAANIFPGDLLLKNFGVTRHGRVIFYDYDEIEFMTGMNFRHLPEPQTPEQEMASEPWYGIGDNDVFPEEFIRFISADPALRRLIRERHGELFDPDYWRRLQEDLRAQRYHDVFPYPQGIRFDPRARSC